MTRMPRNLRRASLLFTLFLCLPSPGGAGGGRPQHEAAFLDIKVKHFEVLDETIVDALWKLARGPAPFAFGFEKVLKKRLSDPDIPDTRFILELSDKSIGEILEALCVADPRYTWSRDGVTVNIFPKDVVGDSTYLLNRKLAKFELNNATDVQNGLLAIVRQLPPPTEQIAEAQAGGGDPYPREPWTVTFENLTVRQIVNRLASRGGACGTWIFGGAQDFRAFGFFNTYLRCQELPATTSKEGR